MIFQEPLEHFSDFPHKAFVKNINPFKVLINFQEKDIIQFENLGISIVPTNFGQLIYRELYGSWRNVHFLLDNDWVDINYFILIVLDSLERFLVLFK